ncbi:MAG: hypothetical protein ABIQ15_08220 [Nocardioides sp.]
MLTADLLLWSVWRITSLDVPATGRTGSSADVVLTEWPGQRRPVAVVVAVTLALAVVERRTHPLAATALGFGSLAVVDMASVVLADEPLFLYAGDRRRRSTSPEHREVPPRRG